MKTYPVRMLFTGGFITDVLIENVQDEVSALSHVNHLMTRGAVGMFQSHETNPNKSSRWVCINMAHVTHAFPVDK